MPRRPKDTITDRAADYVESNSSDTREIHRDDREKKTSLTGFERTHDPGKYLQTRDPGGIPPGYER